jgi:WD40 repeat protein
MQKFTGAQFSTQLCDFAVSSDNKYLLSPSESGHPYLWEIMTGNSISTDHLNLDIKGPLITCNWHPKYNLVAFGGFVELCPIMVYGNVLN